MANTFVASDVRENPVMYVAAAGLTPTLPVTMEAGTVEMPLLARIANPPAVARFTEPGLPPSEPCCAPSLPESVELPSFAVAPSGFFPPSISVPLLVLAHAPSERKRYGFVALSWLMEVSFFGFASGVWRETRRTKNCLLPMTPLASGRPFAVQG